MAAKKSKTDRLIAAAIKGDEKETNAIIQSMSWSEIGEMRDQFKALPQATKAALTKAYSANPNIVPGYMQGPLNAALAAPAPPTVRGRATEDFNPRALTPKKAVPAAAGSAEIRYAIIDRTTAEGLTASALRNLEAAADAAAAVGLTRIDVTAGAGGGHKSHSSGTEIDIKGYNADGSLWTNAQRVAVAEGARQAGADRFGLYQMEKGLGQGTLHIGNSGPGRPAAVWGAHGLISQQDAIKKGYPASAVRDFTNPAEAQFMQAYAAGTPLSPAAEAAAAVAGEREPMLANVPRPRERPTAPPVETGALQKHVLRGGAIRKGERGEHVRELQQFLNREGIKDDRGRPLKVDGIAGTRTKQAIRNFQEEHPGLKVDGIVGPRTLAAIMRDQEPAAAPTADAPTPQALSMMGFGETAGVALMASLTGLPPEAAASISLSGFDARFAGEPPPGMSAAEFDARFGDETLPFTGSTGLNFTATGLPTPTARPFHGNFWVDVWHGLTTGQWSPPSRSAWSEMLSDEHSPPLPEERLKLEFDNAINFEGFGGYPTLGGGGSLGMVQPLSEPEAIYGASRGAAALLNWREQQESAMGSRFSDAFAPAAFGAAIGLFPGVASATWPPFPWLRPSTGPWGGTPGPVYAATTYPPTGTGQGPYAGRPASTPTGTGQGPYAGRPASTPNVAAQQAAYAQGGYTTVSPAASILGSAGIATSPPWGGTPGPVY